MEQASPIPLERLVDKREVLQAELAKGRSVLQQQQAQLQQTQTTILHIQGALTVLDELLREETTEPKIVKLERVGKNGSGDAEVPAPISK